MELAETSDIMIVRELMHCKSKRLCSFSYELKANLLNRGILPSKDSAYKQQPYNAIRRTPSLKPIQAVTIGSKLEKVLLSAYSMLLQEPLPPELYQLLKKQYGLIERCNQSVALLMPDIVGQLELPDSCK